MRKIDLTNFRVATSETARQINRRIALSFLRRHEPMSRADLARRSGLQRSTVSAIVDQLIEEQWVTERDSSRVQRGRRPRSLHLNVERAGILAVELRPELTMLGLAGVDARFVERRQFPTSHDPQQFVRDLAAHVAEIRAFHAEMLIEGMGVSFPGRVDEDGRSIFAPNLTWPPHVSIRSMIETATGLPVTIENAANACALAELWFGDHPENVRHIVAVTVSEGLGVGLLLNGQLVQGAGSMAGEFGHRVVDPSGPPCGCGRRGCWERYASNSAAVGQYLELVRAKGVEPPASLLFEDVLRMALAGDPDANIALDEMARALGNGLGDLITGLAPEVIVVVGELTAIWDRVGPVVSGAIASRVLPGTSTKVQPTDPTTQPRLRGAIALVVQQHFGAPLVA
jgi:predicted NBD/HSP70 family sugar kinase/predicted transcriptional regulator